MKLVCLEEHLATPATIAAWQDLDPTTRDLGDLMIAAMDAAEIDVAVLSHTTPGVQDLPPDRAVPLAREANDLVAQAVSRRSDRFQGFATLPTPDPQAAHASWSVR